MAGNKLEKPIVFISIIILVCSIIPLCMLGFYGHALGDDFEYGVFAKVALENGSVFDAINAAIDGTATQFRIWQGTYSAMFLMHLPPQVFGDFFYKLYPTVLLICFSFSTFFMLKPVVYSFFNHSRSSWFIISSALLFLIFEQVPLMGEAFYWYNGSMYYTGFYALTLFFFGMIFRFCLSEKKYQIVILSLLGLILAGGNYASLLPSLIILLVILTLLIIKKKSSKAILGVSITIGFTLLGFIISILAPGNSARQATSYGTTPAKAILKSLFQAYNYLLGWSNIWLFIVLALLTPLFVRIIKNSSFSFKLPLIVIILGFGIFASASCPTFYAQNNGGAARVFVISWYNMVFFVTGSYFYLLGWLINRKNRYYYPVAYSFLVFVFCVLLLIRPMSDTYVQLNSIHAANAIINGDARYYENQYQKRITQIKSSEMGLNFEPYDVPESILYILHLGDLGPDSENAVNKAFAEFYGKKSVIVKQKE